MDSPRLDLEPARNPSVGAEDRLLFIPTWSSCTGPEYEVDSHSAPCASVRFICDGPCSSLLLILRLELYACFGFLSCRLLFVLPGSNAWIFVLEVTAEAFPVLWFPFLWPYGSENPSLLIFPSDTDGSAEVD